MVILSNTLSIAFVFTAWGIFGDTSNFVFAASVSVFAATCHALVVSQGAVGFGVCAAWFVLGPALSIADDFIFITTEVVISRLARVFEVWAAELVFVLAAAEILVVVV